MRGDNQKKKVASIDYKTFESKIFESLSECSKVWKVPVKEISSIVNKGKYYCHHGKTFVFYSNDETLLADIKNFKNKRYIIENSKNILPKKRTCSICKKSKPLTSKYFDKSKPKSIYKKSKFKYSCKKCRKGESKALYLKNKTERINNYNKRAEYILKVYKKLDKKFNRDFNLTLDWVIENLQKPCEYCGFQSTGFDRIDNNIGHLITNCVPSCTECNNGRMNNFNFDEFKIIGQTIREVKLKRLKNE